MGHNRLLHQVLNLLHGGAAAHFLAGNLHTLGDPPNLQRGHPHVFFGGFIGLGHGHNNLFNVKNDFRAVTFNNFHRVCLLGEFGRSVVLRRAYYRYCGFVKSQAQNTVSQFLSGKSYRLGKVEHHAPEQRIVFIFHAFSKERFEIIEGL